MLNSGIVENATLSSGATLVSEGGFLSEINLVAGGNEVAASGGTISELAVVSGGGITLAAGGKFGS